jgi:hypothetical protein
VTDTEIHPPEFYCYPAPKVCHEHWSGQGGDGWAECCMCSANPCDDVAIPVAIEHGKLDHWRGRLDGVFLARSCLSNAIRALPQKDRPEATDALDAAWTLVRGSVDDPPF